MVAILPSASVMEKTNRVIETLHSIGAQRLEASLCVAVDGGLPRDSNHLSDAEARLATALAESSTVVRLNDPQVDELWFPRWLQLDTESSRGSLLLNDTISLAFEELAPDLLAQGQGRRFSGWMETEGDVRSAAMHVARQMIQLHPKGHRCLLRLHDPAVLWALWPLLSLAQRAGLLGPLKAWWLLDPLGNLIALRAHSLVDGSLPPESFNSQQWSSINHITALNHALRNWLPFNGTISSDALLKAHGVAMQALRRAEALGFDDAIDLSLFAEHALTVHPEFDLHPLVQSVLSKREPDDHYSALIESMSKHDWLVVGSFT